MTIAPRNVWWTFLTKNATRGIRAARSLLEQIKQIYGYNPDAELDDDEANKIVKELQERTSWRLKPGQQQSNPTSLRNYPSCSIPKGDTYQEYANAINNWLKNLHPEQKLLTADWQIPSTKTIFEALQKLVDIEKTFLEVIPNAYGFTLGKVDDWSYDQTNSYVNKFQDAMKTIENSLPKGACTCYLCAIPKWPRAIKGRGQ